MLYFFDFEKKWNFIILKTRQANYWMIITQHSIITSRIILIETLGLLTFFTGHQRKHWVSDLKSNNMQTFSIIIKLIIWIKGVGPRMQLSCSHGTCCDWGSVIWTISKKLWSIITMVKEGVFVNPPMGKHIFNPSTCATLSGNLWIQNQPTHKMHSRLAKATEKPCLEKINEHRVKADVLC